MSGRTWLCLDAHFLSWRAYHTTGTLSFGDKATGVLYGFFRDLINFTELHDTKHVMIAFDRKPYKRKKLLKTYKVKVGISPIDEENHAKVQEQIKLLRTKYLKEVGFRNIFSQQGYEADDVIASFIHGLKDSDSAIIITADHDYYQLLNSGRIICWNPNSKRAYTEASLKKEFGIDPSQWAIVKAMSGCKSDNVLGLRSIGEKTAAKFLRGEVKSGSAIEKTINSGVDILEKNLQLVRLPFKGVNEFIPKKDQISKSAWHRMLKRLGMVSMIDKYPQGAK